MNIAESGQSGMRAQQPHGKMLSLVDATYKDISKQMRQDAMFKAAATNQPVDMGKSLNLLDLQLYARSEQEKRAPILAHNLAEGNLWLEDSGLENDTNGECNFFPPPKIPHISLLIWQKKTTVHKMIIHLKIIMKPKRNHQKTQQKEIPKSASLSILNQVHQEFT